MSIYAKYMIPITVTNNRAWRWHSDVEICRPRQQLHPPETMLCWQQLQPPETMLCWQEYNKYYLQESGTWPPHATLFRHGKTMVTHGKNTDHVARPLGLTSCNGPPQSIVCVCVCGWARPARRQFDTPVREFNQHYYRSLDDKSSLTL
jgi:hypothetical protein